MEQELLRCIKSENKNRKPILESCKTCFTVILNFLKFSKLKARKPHIFQDTEYTTLCVCKCFSDTEKIIVCQHVFRNPLSQTGKEVYQSLYRIGYFIIRQGRAYQAASDSTNLSYQHIFQHHPNTVFISPQNYTNYLTIKL